MFGIFDFVLMEFLDNLLFRLIPYDAMRCYACETPAPDDLNAYANFIYEKIYDCN